MNGLYLLIFVWTSLSLVYGDRNPSCNMSYVRRIRIYDNESVILTIPEDRRDETWKQECYWYIEAGSFHMIFEEFDLYDSVNCKFESLEIKFPGYYRNKSMTFCGTSYPKELQFHNTDFHIVYSWQSSIKKSFRIIIRKSDQLTTKTYQLNVSTTPMYLYSPGYPERYGKNLNMEWILSANDPKKRIMLEFLLLKTEDNNSQCQNDFIQVRGDNTNFVTCGHKSKHVVALNDSSVNITFKTNGDEENEGFIIRYYTEPYPENRKSCVREGLTLTALPYKPTKFVFTNHKSDSFCNWIIKAGTSDHVIVLKIISYSMSSDPDSKCDVMLMVKDFTHIDTTFEYTLSYNYDIVAGCSDKFLRYYHSKNPAISVQLLDPPGVITNMDFSYYSVPIGEFSLNRALPIGHRPSYIYYSLRVSSDQNSIKLIAESGCIDISWRSKHTKVIGSYLEVYDGDSSGARYLTNADHKNKKLIGSKQFMFIRLIQPNVPLYIFLDVHVLLEMKSTDQCNDNVQKLVIPEHQRFITIQSPKTGTGDAAYDYEISASRKNSVLYIRGVVGVSDGTCESSRVEFYNSNAKFYTWCILKHFSQRTSFSKIQFSFYFGGKNSNTSCEVTVIEIPDHDLQSGHRCYERQTFYPSEGESSSLHITNYPRNYDCSWLFVAPLKTTIQLKINHVKIESSYCTSSLELYNSREYKLENEILHYCGQSQNIIGRVFISNDVLLLHVLSYSVNPIVDIDITYSVASSAIKVWKIKQTRTFYRPSESMNSVVSYHFTKEKKYSKYRMVLEIECGVLCRSDIGLIIFTDVIVDGKYYQNYNVTKESITLYGASDTITMNIYKIKQDSLIVGCILEEIGSVFNVLEQKQQYKFYRTQEIMYIRPDSGFKKYQIVLEIKCERFCDGDILTTFTNVIVDGKYYQNYNVTKESTTLYGASDTITMNIYKIEHDSLIVSYMLKEIGECRSSAETLYATDHYQTVATPNMHGFYDTACTWLIHANSGYVVELVITYSDLGTSTDDDSIDIIDSDMVFLINLQGNGVYNITSQSDFLTVKFHSDLPLSQSGGAVIKYIRTPSQIEHEDTAAIVVGCLIALGVILVIGFIVVCIVCKRRKKHRRRQTPQTPQNNSGSTNNIMLRIRSRTPQNHSNATNTTIYILSRPTTHNDILSQPPPSYSEVTKSRPVMPSSNDGLPSYELSRQFEIPKRSVDNADHSSVDHSPAELPSSNDGLPNYETSRQHEIPNRSVETADTADLSSIDRPSTELPSNDVLPSSSSTSE